ncbi:hypothetical protein AK812_SmicGene41093 [Symbiodinium microadriaticum]|uniref:Uncharacterized protein n=1 Tax=Symbiodinium microadriaticum TaxID=2951 RepID=A0A1Q9C756_SYMMI|nr:hypothetical protein AK812_SmicGene41093 [Symbiodinium microadriaticum]
MPTSETNLEAWKSDSQLTLVCSIEKNAGSVMMLPSITTAARQVTFYEGEPPTSLLRDMTEGLWQHCALGAGGCTTFYIALHRDLQATADQADALAENAPTAGSRFAVVISLSHVLGDGFTYYRIYGALDQREKEIGGTVYPAGEGKLEFPAAMAQTLGMEKVAWLNSRRARWGSMLDRNLRSRHRWSAWEVDTAWVEEVLTSAFLTSGKFAYGVMSDTCLHVTMGGACAGLA